MSVFIKPQREEILSWLCGNDSHSLQRLQRAADEIRQQRVGEEVHLRGLLEFSNDCPRNCLYCGIRANRNTIVRYTMDQSTILEGVKAIVDNGIGTVVLQSGELESHRISWLCQVVEAIKTRWDIAVTLSVGEISKDEALSLRQAGADRYLLRFETSNPDLYRRIHPAQPGKQSFSRIDILRTMRNVGFEIGSGFLIGLPGQTWEDLANDILLAHQLDLDMIGVGPYVPHPETPLATLAGSSAWQQIVPASTELTCRVLALLRILCPNTNMPNTTALTTLESQHTPIGLQYGANVIMPCFTPLEYRVVYDVYPGKPYVEGSHKEKLCHLTKLIHAQGRRISTGRGTSPNFRKSHEV